MPYNFRNMWKTFKEVKGEKKKKLKEKFKYSKASKKKKSCLKKIDKKTEKNKNFTKLKMGYKL